VHCADCSDQDIQTPAVAICQNCGRALCADCTESRPGPGGMNIGCRHGSATVVIKSGGLRIAAHAA
jgi:hypothetical protein